MFHFRMIAFATFLAFVAIGQPICIGNNLPVNNDQIEQWIVKLSSDQFAEREDATKRLARFGVDAVPYLVDQIRNGDPESATRSAEILEKIALSSDEDIAIRVARIFRLLASNGRPDLFEKSSDMRALWKKRRVERAVERLQELGAAVQKTNVNQIFIDSFSYDPGGETDSTNNEIVDQAKPEEMLSDAEIEQQVSTILEATDEENLAQFDIEMAADAESSTPADSHDVINRSGIVRLEGRVVVAGGDLFVANANNYQDNYNITIAEGWKGDGEDLSLLRYLPSITLLTISDQKLTPELCAIISEVESLQVLYLDGTEYELEPVLKLMREKPNLNIQVEGSAFLGVTAENAIHPETEQPCCRIQTVVPMSGADKAELQPQDLIVSIDGVDIGTFQQLVVTIATYKPGSEVQMEIMRFDETMQVTAKLGHRPEAGMIPPPQIDDPFDDD